MSVGPAVAMERTVAEIKKPTDGEITDVEVAHWLQDAKYVFRQDVIEQTKRDPSAAKNSKALAYVSEWEVPKSLRTLSNDEIQAMADDFANCGDYFDELAKKFRLELRKRNSI